MTEPVPFAIIGAGWRTAFFVRIAAALPARFRITGVQARDAGRARATLGAGVPVVTDLDALLAAKPRFVVVSVGCDAAPGFIAALVERGVPVLTETPPAPDLPRLRDLYARCVASGRVQVAEQYPFQPLHAARIALCGTGRLGAIHQADVSAAHGYHGVCLIRRLLGVGLGHARVRAWRHVAPVVDGATREGPPKDERLVPSTRVMGRLDFGARMGVFDFDDQQYFSHIRSPRVMIRGERGQIVDERVRYLHDARTPIVHDLVRQDTGQLGNLDGHHHLGYIAGDRWVYRNPFPGARLFDDEIAIATCLERMHEFTDGGDPFYDLAEGCHDHYLGTLILRAAETDSTLETESQPWFRD